MLCRNVLTPLRRHLPSPPRRHALSRLGCLALSGGVALAAPVLARARPARTLPGPVNASPAAADTLPRPPSWQALLGESGATGRPVVVLFSIPGCGFCELVRHDHLRYLARDPEARAVLVAELYIFDRGPFTEGSSPAALAASLGIHVAPTVAFFGPDGELAERLVGYHSADFYGAYLDRRIAVASAAMGRDKGG